MPELILDVMAFGEGRDLTRSLEIAARSRRDRPR